jgi:predicted GNAT family acetyltransferase
MTEYLFIVFKRLHNQMNILKQQADETLALITRKDENIRALTAERDALVARVSELENENDCFLDEITLYRGGQLHKDLQEIMEAHNSSIARVKVLEGVVKQGVSAVNAALAQGIAEAQGAQRTTERLEQIIQEFFRDARAALEAKP